MGARIEIINKLLSDECPPSSLPVRERGLKYAVMPALQNQSCVAPREGARIEISTLFLLMVIVMSLPVWERGLKPDKTDLIDEQEDVAPRVGVRIETPLKL